MPQANNDLPPPQHFSEFIQNRERVLDDFDDGLHEDLATQPRELEGVQVLQVEERRASVYQTDNMMQEQRQPQVYQ